MTTTPAFGYIVCCAIGLFINLISNSYEKIKIQSLG